jgi:hypothetical protein
MGCKVQACHDWTWDGCSQNGRCCSSWRSSSIHDVPVWFGNDGMSSYRVDGCNDHLVQAFEHANYGGSSITLVGGFHDVGNWNDRMTSLKITGVPTSQSGKLSADTDSACPGSSSRYEKSGGKRYRCFYSNSNGGGLQTLKNAIGGDGGMSALYTDLTNRFCSISENFTQNIGGGETCTSRNVGSEIAKQYCSVGDRIATDGACTKENLGNLYSGVAEAYCKTSAGKADLWCSCYNVTQGVCDTDSSAAGCDKKRRGFDKLVEGTPSEFKTQWNGMEGCFEGVCQGAKYVPENANQNCDRSVQICVQDFDFNSISGGSTINATCNQTANTGTPPSVGDGPSGGGGGGGGGGGIDDYIPRSIDELKTDSKKQMAVGGVGALFLMCCLLLIVVLVSSGGGGGGGGPTRFRR